MGFWDLNPAKKLGRWVAGGQLLPGLFVSYYKGIRMARPVAQSSVSVFCLLAGAAAPLCLCAAVTAHWAQC
jgi:hypothetical protein